MSLEGVNSMVCPSYQSAGRVRSSDLAPTVVERKRPGVADGILNSEHAGFRRIGRMFDHVQPVRIAPFVRTGKLRV